MIAAGAAVVGTVASISSANKAGKRAAAAQASQDEILGRQEDRADEQWENYKTNYLPLEQQYLEMSKNFGSIANQEKAAANTAAAVAGKFAGARDQLNRTPGLDPNSQQYLREAAKLNLAEAASSAAGQTAARENVEKTGAAMLQDASSLGKGIASSATSQLNSVAGARVNKAAAAGQRADNMAGGVGQMVGGLYKSGAFDAIGGMFSPSAPSQYSLTSAPNYTPSTGGIGLSYGGGLGLSADGGGLGVRAPAGVW